VPTYSINQHTEGAVTVVDLFGEIDLAAVPDIQSRLDALLGGGVRTVMIDLTEVGFIDSAGIGALVSGRRAFAAADAAFYLRNARGRVAEVLDLTGVTEFLAPPAEPAAAVATSTSPESEPMPPAAAG
jgi:anti-sigma B factor antagonist